MFIFQKSIFVNRVFVISNFSIVKVQSLQAVFSLIFIMLFDSYVTDIFYFGQFTDPAERAVND